MSKRKLEVPPLRLNPETERSTRALMARMRAPAEAVEPVDVHPVKSETSTTQDLHHPQSAVETHPEALDAHQDNKWTSTNHLLNAHQETKWTPTIETNSIHHTNTKTPTIETLNIHHETDQASTKQTPSIHQAAYYASTAQLADAQPPLSGRPTALVDAKTPTIPALVDAQTSTRRRKDVHLDNKTHPRRGDRHDATKMRHTVRLKSEISERFRLFCVRKGLDFQDFVELAGVHFLECGRPLEEGRVDAQTSHDDLKIYKSHEDIINLYLTLTGNRWKPSDDREGLQFAKTDRRLLEIGMLQTLLNFKGRKINSFRYFVPEIQAVEDEAREVHSSSEQIEGVLRRRRQMWEAKQAEKEKR